MQTTVGTSSRTPFKHWLLNHMLGRIVGALSSGRTPCNPVLTVVDMCAGDGLSYGESAQSSPAIIAKHITSTFPGFLKMKSRTAHLFEREEAWDYPSFALECLCEDCHAGKHESDSLPLWFEDTLAVLPNNSASQDLFCDTLKELFKRGEKKGIDFALSELFGALSRSNDHDRHMQNRKAKKAQPKTA
jgi:hypothetical protein